MAKISILFMLATLMACSNLIIAQIPGLDALTGMMNGGGLGGGLLGGGNPMGSLMGGGGGLPIGQGGFGGNQGGWNDGNNGQYQNENFDNNYGTCPNRPNCKCQGQRNIQCSRNSCGSYSSCCKVDCCRKQCVRNNGK